MKMFRRFAIIASLFLAASPALAQWQVPDHSVPIGRGGGSSGFKNAAPGVVGQGFFSNGTTSDPSFQFPPVFTPTVPGAVPASGGADTTKFLNQAGAFTSPSVTPSSVTYTPPGAGGIAQSLQAVLQKTVYLTDYALCNGTDETTAIQAAINQAQLVKGALILPGGAPATACGFSGTLVISQPMAIRGQGRFISMLLGTGGAAQGMINVTSNTAVDFSDFWLNTTTANKSGGFGIQFNGTAPGAQVNFSNIDRINFTNHQNAIDFENASYWAVRNCTFQLFSNAGGAQVVIRNGASGDSGDNEFVSNWFFGGFSNTVYVLWQSSGGTRFRGNKFLGNGTAGVAMSFQLAGTIGTGLTSIVDNSFDNLATVPISITTATASNVFVPTTINDNRFNGDGTHPTQGAIYVNAVSGSVIGAVSVVGNTFTSMPLGVVMPSVSTANVSSNLFGGVGQCLNTGTVGAVLFAANLLGGCSTVPTSTSGTVTITANK